MEIKQILDRQKYFFQTHKTKSVDFRIESLNKLERAIRKYYGRIDAALKLDLNKSEFESYMSEIGLTLNELTYVKKRLRFWVKKKKVRSPISQFCSQSFMVAEPFGVVLIMSPWNYPFMLSIEPLIGAIAAGNCCILKLSEYSTATSKVIAEIIADAFPRNYIAAVQGGKEENAIILDQRFDYIFFTGSKTVGRIVMEKASEHLTPVTLELGGKSPCIVDKTANIKLAAKRLVFGKYLNAGQTCVAPDYLLVHSSVRKKLIIWMIRYIKQFFGEDPIKNEEYPKIINERHFNRICELAGNGNILAGGYGNKNLLKFAPTILDGVAVDSPIMKEEIFGPILPVFTYESWKEAAAFIQKGEKPLAFYLFTTDKGMEEAFIKNLSFGGGCINDTMVHLATSRMGFGGVGSSGMGSYHGKCSFDTFSHKKSMVKKCNWIDLPMRYPPYKKSYFKIMKAILK